MVFCVVSPAMLHGTINLPSSKSQSLRAILFGALAHDNDTNTEIHNILGSPDSQAMIDACRMLGAQIQQDENKILIKGFSGQPAVPDDVIHAGNSGLVLRFISALAILIPATTIITGDHSIRHNRPMTSLLFGLNQLGAHAFSSRGDDKAPIVITGQVQSGGLIHITGEDSQPISALLVACQFLNSASEIKVTNPGETPWVQMTLNWFDRLGLQYQNKGYEYYLINGGGRIAPFNYTVPFDLSSLAFPLVAAIVTSGSCLTFPGVDLMNSDQEDKQIVQVLKRMGAKFIIDEQALSITAYGQQTLYGIEIDINDFVDSIAIIAVLGTFAIGKTVIRNAQIACHKESNRIQVMCQELSKMGAKIIPLQDGLMVWKSQLIGCEVDSHQDHRVAMALAVAGMMAKGQTRIKNFQCVNKTYPNFITVMQSVGSAIQEEP